MKNKQLLYEMYCGMIFLLLIAAGQAHETGNPISEEVDILDSKIEGNEQVLRPRRGYPKGVKYVKTPCQVMSIHIGTIETPPTPLSGLPKITEVNEQWERAEAGDEVYDITRWFLKDGEISNPRYKKKRWVYYNLTNGYIIANADFFLKASIQAYASGSILLNGFNPRLRIIYLEVSDKVELNFQALQKSPHKILLRGSVIHGSPRRFMQDGSAVYEINQGVIDNPMNLKLRSGSNSACEASLKSNYIQKYYELKLKLSVKSDIFYENELVVTPNKWLIHECGISVKGKRKVLVIRVDHVNYLGESLQFPFDESINQNVGVDEDHGSDGDPFGEEGTYKFYRVPVDMFNHLHDEDETSNRDPFGETEENDKISANVMDISEFLSHAVDDTEAYYFRYQNLLLAKFSGGGHLAMAEILAELELRNQMPSLQCNLLFYEIDFSADYEERSWKIEDVMSGNPVKLGSIGSLISFADEARMKMRENECTLILYYPDMGKPHGSHHQFRKLDLDLNMPSMKITQKYQGIIKIGRPEVVCLGRNPDNNKLTMMLISVKEGEKNDEE